MVDEELPTIIILTRDKVFSKCMNALQKVSAQASKPILICEEGDQDPLKLGFKCLTESLIKSNKYIV